MALAVHALHRQPEALVGEKDLPLAPVLLGDLVDQLVAELPGGVDVPGFERQQAAGP